MARHQLGLREWALIAAIVGGLATGATAMVRFFLYTGRSAGAYVDGRSRAVVHDSLDAHRRGHARQR